MSRFRYNARVVSQVRVFPWADGSSWEANQQDETRLYRGESVHTCQGHNRPVGLLYTNCGLLDDLECLYGNPAVSFDWQETAVAVVTKMCAF
jgi:hypothetical protein